MEYICGKHSDQIDCQTLLVRRQAYAQLWLDIGTGDGRFVEQVAKTHSDTLIVGLDACRENLVRVSKRALPNTLFVIANAEKLPLELTGLADLITINFPWGSLLEGLLVANSSVISNLQMVARPMACVEIRLNESALLAAGWTLEDGCAQLKRVLQSNGFEVGLAHQPTKAILQSFPSTWAKRLGSGASSSALFLTAIYKLEDVVQGISA
jgi:16S rRNA (adenine(1408)-N(1))-methyltransferase